MVIQAWLNRTRKVKQRILGSREAVWRVARVHLERTGNTRIEFRSGERHFRPPRLKKSVGLNGVCRRPRGGASFSSKYLPFLPLWRVFLEGEHMCGVDWWAPLPPEFYVGCFVFWGGGCGDYWKEKRCARIFSREKRNEQGMENY